MFRFVRYTRLIERLDELYASDRGRDAMQQYVSKFVRSHLTVKDALIRKMKGKPPSTSLSSEPSNKNNNNNKLSLDGRLMVNIGKQHFKVAICHHRTDLFTIKKSSLQNAGLGLFAARKYKNGSCLGYYCGKIVTGLAYRRTKYAIMTNTNPPICVQGSPQDVWMGIHFANDPNYGKYGREEVDEDDPTYNIRIDGKLRVTALKDIEPDEELFLHYNLRDKHDDDESNDDDESAADDESDNDDESAADDESDDDDESAADDESNDDDESDESNDDDESDESDNEEE